MPKYAIAFAAQKPALLHQVVEMDSRESALRFFFKVTVGKPEVTRNLAFVYEPRKLLRVLPPDDVLRCWRRRGLRSPRRC